MFNKPVAFGLGYVRDHDRNWLTRVVTAHYWRRVVPGDDQDHVSSSSLYEKLRDFCHH